MPVWGQYKQTILPNTNNYHILRNDKHWKQFTHFSNYNYTLVEILNAILKN